MFSELHRKHMRHSKNNWHFQTNWFILKISVPRVPLRKIEMLGFPFPIPNFFKVSNLNRGSN